MEYTSLANRTPLAGLLIILILLSVAFRVLRVTSAQGDKPILGYPYLAHGGDNENFSTSPFQLNGTATITSMSCQMYIGYSLNEKDEDTTYRFAIYSDNQGQIGELIGQTELGTISKPIGQVLTIDDFQTLNFTSPISLQAGTYWLASVVQGPNINIDEDDFVESAQRVRINLNSTIFPSTLSSLQYIDNQVVAIYASGQGTSSVMPLQVLILRILGYLLCQFIARAQILQLANSKFSVIYRSMEQVYHEPALNFFIGILMKPTGSLLVKQTLLIMDPTQFTGRRRSPVVT